jgi:hypothetical protein
LDFAASVSEAQVSVLVVLIPIGWATIVAFFVAMCGVAQNDDGEAHEAEAASVAAGTVHMASPQWTGPPRGDCSSRCRTARASWAPTRSLSRHTRHAGPACRL